VTKKDGDLAWPLFASCVAARLEAGRREYGDKSFSREPTELVREVEEELFDVAGWAFILWSRMRDVREALEGLRPANDAEPRARPLTPEAPRGDKVHKP